MEIGGQCCTFIEVIQYVEAACEGMEAFSKVRNGQKMQHLIFVCFLSPWEPAALIYWEELPPAEQMTWESFLVIEKNIAEPINCETRTKKSAF